MEIKKVGILIIGIAAKKQGGKDTTAKFIRRTLKKAGYNVKIIGFADAFKKILIDNFFLSHQQVFGSEEDKNTLTQYLWENLPGYNGSRTGLMTVREFMQEFSTRVCRKIHDKIWIENFFKQVKIAEKKQIQVIIANDIRHQPEVDSVVDTGGKVIKLMRGKMGDNHSSETEMDKLVNITEEVDNRSISIKKCNAIVKSLLQKWGLI